MRIPSNVGFLLSATVVGLAIAAAGCEDDETTTDPTTTPSGGTGGTGGSGGVVGGGGTGGTGGSGGVVGGGGTGGTGGMVGGGGAGGGIGGGVVGGGGAGGGGGSSYCASLLPIPSGGAEVYYRGDFVTNNDRHGGLLAYPGPTQTTLAVQGMDGADELTGIALSPDGTQIAVTGRSTGNDPFVLALYAADGSGAQTVLVTANDENEEMDDPAWSPDGTMIAYRHDPTTNNATELWVVPAAGGAAKSLSGAFNDSDFDVVSFAWAPDLAAPLQYLAYIADPVTQSAFSAFSVEVTAASPAPVDMVPEAADGMAVVGSSPPEFDCTGAVYFRGDFETDDLYRLYRADMDGQDRIQVPGTDLDNGEEASVGAIRVSPDGSMLAFASEAPVATLYQIYTMSLDDNVPTVRSAVQSAAIAGETRGPSFYSMLQWSPDQSMLAVVADWEVSVGVETDNHDQLFILDPHGAAGGVRIIDPPPSNNQDVNDVLWALDGTRLFIRGDLIDPNDTELYSTADFATADQTISGLLEQDVPNGGDVAKLYPGG